MHVVCCVPQDERLQEMLLRLQSKFKAVSSMMGCLQAYPPFEGGGPSLSE